MDKRQRKDSEGLKRDFHATESAQRTVQRSRRPAAAAKALQDAQARKDRWPVVPLVLTRELIAAADSCLSDIYGAGGGRLSRSELGRALFAAFIARCKSGKLDFASIKTEQDLAALFTGGR